MKEIRSIPNGSFEVRTMANGQKRVSGYLAVYNQRSVDLGGFTEIVAPGAFQRSLGGDILLLAQHDTSKVLARTTSGTLTLRSDDEGLGFDATLPSTSYARDLAESMERGDISGCSFGFNCISDDWSLDGETNAVTRTLRDVNLVEGSIVTSPAYPQTSVSLRSAPNGIRQRLKPEFDDYQQRAILAVLAARRRTY